jgi:uncharacterized membrane protein
MSYLIAATFDDAGWASETWRALCDGESLQLEQAAIVIRDELGIVSARMVHPAESTAGRTDAGTLVMMIRHIFALPSHVFFITRDELEIRRPVELEIDPTFAKTVSTLLTPGSSALFVVSPNIAFALSLPKLAPYQEKIHFTVLPQAVG